MKMIDPVVEINGIKQDLNYFLLPKSKDDRLLVDFPYIIHENVDLWLTSGSVVDLFFDTGYKKYTFYDCVVEKMLIGNNRFGVKSRTVYISFEVMLFGITRRKHA